MRRPLVEEDRPAVNKSMSVLLLLVYAARMEYQSFIDVKYPMPILNQHAKRILDSLGEIQTHLKVNRAINISIENLDTVEEYAASLLMIANKLIDLPLEQAKEATI